jgi:Protein of unknown function (DUF3822)
LSSTFRIGKIESVSTDARLLIEISQQAISFVVIDNGNECVALYSHHYVPANDMEKSNDVLKQLVSDETILQEDFKSTTVVYAHPQSVMIPSDLLQEAQKKEMLELVHGDISEAFIRTDFLFRQYTHNIYPVPKQVDAVVSYLFSSPVSTHLYSLLPDMFQSPGNHLHCIFSPSSFTAMLVKEGKLQAMQTFAFKTPEDVAYYLLQICEAFETDINETILHLNGMIDKSSSLYTELYKYFLNVEFATLPSQYSYPEEINNYPLHYFSHLFAAASCV